MGMCSGKTECKIYRDKKFCSKVDEKRSEYGVCQCRHAALQCEVDTCVMERMGCHMAPNHAAAQGHD